MILTWCPTWLRLAHGIPKRNPLYINFCLLFIMCFHIDNQKQCEWMLNSTVLNCRVDLSRPYYIQTTDFVYKINFKIGSRLNHKIIFFWNINNKNNLREPIKQSDNNFVHPKTFLKIKISIKKMQKKKKSKLLSWLEHFLSISI